MPQEFFSTLTVVGEARLASAAALGSSLQLTHLAVGDGGGVRVMPTPAQTKLVREIRRAPVNRVETDPANPGQIIIEQVIPETEGGWWIREIGVFDKDGNLIAVGNCPDTYKPMLAEGSGRTQVIRLVLIVSSTDAVTLKIDPSVVLATRQHVTETVARAVSDHIAQPDPHPQYLTESEGKQRIDAAVAALVAGAPGALDTLKELADALGGDQNFSATVMGLIAGKLGKTGTAADSAKLGGQLPGYYAKAEDLAKAGGDPLLWPRTSPSRTNIHAGYAPLDGQELSRALYPDAWAAIQAGAVPVVTEAEWQADPLKRGAYTYGNGSTTFRMPDWNGKSVGAKGAVFVRGDGVLSAGAPGVIQSDDLKSHVHGVPVADQQSVGGQKIAEGFGAVDYAASTYAAGGSETRPLNVTSVWVCRLFGAVTNPGVADAAQLATEVARLWGQLSGKQDVSSAYGPSLRNISYTSAQRASGVVYYNTSGVPRTVFVQSTTMSGFTLGSISKTLNLATVSLMVMPGEAYSVTYQSTLNFWIETTRE
ncbi:phage tail protein [Laribacter hongkongensis]|uniref:phage tail-collar fiber domain-containing protein n=1 Tax=Laribacter hongkongensis TaxID=168471 RepID=UPI001EFCA8A4|nr:phage tail protein [Laribacter hongkongensis]MCG8991821.1 phage tail protein [Laribacter hongkongensis]MCG8998744.1 phage tail protein [Laribacter hongkongensis]MCG9000180.1 phage tail protein [Laribacter hongkongensis]MCG9004463.1 phage tail protein [Laribacter hongkongensis]MCG9006571.1 phage tail protein [Laribacter hongkongensis]